MVLRMITRWAETKGFEVEVDEIQEGQEAGITSATFIVKGRYAYGMLEGERRCAPADPDLAVRRQRPPPDRVRVVRLRSGARTGRATRDRPERPAHRHLPLVGRGGQHVNVTDSAVRITHIPTGVVVSCQNERSQLQNRAKAMQILAARSPSVSVRSSAASWSVSRATSRTSPSATRSAPTRSRPYQLVKDERTRYETGNVQAVLDGDLDAFIEAYLHWRRARHTVAS